MRVIVIAHMYGLERLVLQYFTTTKKKHKTLCDTPLRSSAHIFGTKMTSTNLYTLLPATETDINALIAFGRAEFTRTFGHGYTSDDLETYLNEAYTVDLYSKWINDPDYCVYVAFDLENKIAGYVLAGKNTLPLQNCGYDDMFTANASEIKRLYVHPDTFGKGVSDMLLSKSLEWLQNKGYSDNIFLGVYSENPRAIRFYNKHKFEKVSVKVC